MLKSEQREPVSKVCPSYIYFVVVGCLARRPRCFYPEDGGGDHSGGKRGKIKELEERVEKGINCYKFE